MAKAKHKPRPDAPLWWWLDYDNCYRCKNRNNCNQCKALKQFKHNKQKQISKEKYSYGSQ